MMRWQNHRVVTVYSRYDDAFKPAKAKYSLSGALSRQPGRLQALSVQGLSGGFTVVERRQTRLSPKAKSQPAQE